MIFKPFSRIEKVLKFQTQGVLLVISQSGIYLNGEKIEEPNSFNVAFFLEEFIVFGNLNKLSKYSFSTKKTEILNPQWSYYWDFFVDNKVLISNNRRKNENYERIADYYFFDIERNELSAKIFTEKPQVKIIKRKGYFIQDNTLRSLSLLTGEYEWEVDLGEYGDIIKILGLEEGFLWVLLSKRAEHFRADAVLGIDPTKGQILHRYNSEVLDVNLLAFAEDKKSIIAINYINRASWLMELNLPALSVKRDVLIQSVHEAAIYIRQYVIQDGLMYFTAVQKGGFWPQYLGVLDIATLELLWHKKVIDIEAGFNGPPQVSQDKLYALDTAGNLYVFEKEEDTKPTLAK